MHENKLKLYSLYNEIYDNLIDKYLMLSKENKTISQEILYF